MEHLHQPYDSVMAMPSSRRHRYAMRKLEAMKTEQRAQEASNARMRRK